MAEHNKPPVPPFSLEDAIQKTRMAEDAWNSRNPDQVCAIYTGLVSQPSRKRTVQLTNEMITHFYIITFNI